MAQRVNRLAAGLVAEDQLGRIAGHNPHQHEDERQHRKKRDHGKAETADQKSGHLVKCVASVTGGDRFSEPFSS